MKKTISVILSLCIAFSAFGCISFAAVTSETETTVYSSEREINFNKGWKFFLGDPEGCEKVSFADTGFENVDLPHDFSITQDFSNNCEAESGYLPGGTGWYRKSFILNNVSGDSDIVISFDGVYSDAYVYVNGNYVGENHYGYNTFAFDITDYLNYGNEENIIAVKAVNDQPNSRWYSGSGIYRDVTLYVTDKIHSGLNGIYITTPDIENGTGTVSISDEIISGYDESKTVTVTGRIYKKDGTEVQAESSTQLTIPAGGTAKAALSMTVDSPELWDTENPALYKAEVSISLDGRVIDTASETFGFRYFRFDSSTGFSLNGKNMKLNGVCMHHDQGALGSAAYGDTMRRQITIMKDMGVNAIRTSHNPADEDMIEICSEMGILVLDESFDCWSDSKNGNYNDFGRYFSTEIRADNGIMGGEGLTWSEFVLKSTVRRDRNQPAVFAWSLGNELMCGTDGKTSGTYPAIAQDLIDTVKSEDSTRPCTYGDDSSGYGNSTTNAIADVFQKNGGIVGLNYADNSELDNMISRHPGCCLFESETASQTNSRGIYCNIKDNDDSDGKYHLTSYDTSAVPWGITAHETIYQDLTHDCLAGQFVWTGFDYIGEPTPWNGNSSDRNAYPNSSYFGIVETTGFEKDTYYLYRSQWNQGAGTLHLVTAWDSGNMYVKDGKTPVVIYSDAAKIELYENGKLISTSVRTVNETPAGHKYLTYTCSSNDTSVCTAETGTDCTALYSAFNVVYEKGTISAKAYDENGNEITDSCSGSSSVSTPGAVSKLNVYADRTEMTADGCSLTYVTADVTDAEGNIDTKAGNTIRFTLEGEGEIAGVDNGDQASTEKFQQSSVLKSSKEAVIKAYAGKALVIIKSTGKAGQIKLTASSDGLSGAEAGITSVKSDEKQGIRIAYTGSYSVNIGETVTPDSTASVISSGGSETAAEIKWDSADESIFTSEGNYTLKGTVTAEGTAYTVTCAITVTDPSEPTLWERIKAAFRKALSAFSELIRKILSKITGR